MNDQNLELAARHCEVCAPGTPALAEVSLRELLAQVPAWTLEDHALVRTFTFRNYPPTLAFVNAVAWIAQVEDHHPDITFGYKTCRIRYWTHAASGLTENDFICAAKIDRLLPPSV